MVNGAGPDRFGVPGSSELGQPAICLRSPVAEELPNAAYLFDHIQVEGGHQELIVVVRCLGEDLTARVDKVGGAVEFAQVPGLFFADAVDTAHEVSVGGGMSR